MLTPEYLEECADELLQSFADLEEELLAALLEELLKTDFEEEDFKENMYAKARILFTIALGLILNHKKETDKKLLELFEDSGAHTILYEDRLYATIGKFGIPFISAPELMQILEAGYIKTSGIISNMTMTTAISTQDSFINACNTAYYKISGGNSSYNQAIREVVSEVAENGGQYVYYESGHRDRLDVAVRRAALTGVNQTAAVLQIARAQEMGEDLVETSAHAGARPEHDEWQGQVFSLSGQHSRYPAFEESTGYGTGAGLCGWNCRHSFHTYFDGISTPAYSREDLAAMNASDIEYEGGLFTQYEISQMQRQGEREIRSVKRTLAGLNTAIMNTNNPELGGMLKADFTTLSLVLKGKQSGLHAFVNSTAQQRQRPREQIFGFGRSEIMKAVWAAKKG